MYCNSEQQIAQATSDTAQQTKAKLLNSQYGVEWSGVSE